MDPGVEKSGGESIRDAVVADVGSCSAPLFDSCIWAPLSDQHIHLHTRGSVDVKVCTLQSTRALRGDMLLSSVVGLQDIKTEPRDHRQEIL